MMLKYSLRTVFCGIFLSAVALSLLRRRMQSARTQSETIAALEEMGATVGYEHEWDFERDCFSGASVPGGPLRAVFGDHFFLKPHLIIIDEFPGDASSLRIISNLKELDTVAIVDSPEVDDGVVDILLELPKLDYCSLNGTSVTTKGIARLRNHSSLNYCAVSRTHVRHDELDYLRSIMPRCDVDWEE